MSFTLKYYDEINGSWANVTGQPGAVLRLDNDGMTTDNALDDVSVTAFGEMGGAIKSASLAVHPMGIQTDSELTSGVLYLVAGYFTYDVAASGLTWFQTTQGSYTNNNFNGIGIYSPSGTTSIALVQDSNNDGDMWKGTSDAWIKKPFKVTKTIPKGYHFLAFLYSASAVTQAPRIGSGPWAWNDKIGRGDFSNNKFICGQLTGQTSLPATINLTNIVFTYSHIPFGIWVI